MSYGVNEKELKHEGTEGTEKHGEMRNKLRNPFAIGCLALVILPIHCYFTFISINLLRVEINYRKWLSQSIDSYIMSVIDVSYVEVVVPPYYMGQTLFVDTVTVANEQVQSSLSASRVVTVDNLFERARNCAFLPWCNAQFDNQYGIVRYIEQNTGIDRWRVTLASKLQFREGYQLP